MIKARKKCMKKIQVGDFRLGKEEKDIINEVLDSGRLSEGPKVNEFEKRWAEFVGTRYCITTCSGTAALIAGLTALKYYKRLKNGTKVITTPLTYIATAAAISNVGFQPVFVDVDPTVFNITPENIEALLQANANPEEYAIILPVHLMGYPARMDEINKIAERYGLITFEDSAQAHGTTYKGKKTGSMSLLSIFSFYIAHNIQAGEMGAINTNDPDINRLARKIKTQGRMCDCSVCRRSSNQCPKINAYEGNDDFDPRFTHDLIGYNFKTMEFQAALAIRQLEKVDWIIKKRQENVKYLNERLKKYANFLQLPKYSAEISYLAYPIIIKGRTPRKWLRYELEKNGIETRPLFGCIPTQQPAYAHLKMQYAGRLPNAEYLGTNAFYIGCHQYLQQEDLEYIVDIFDKVLERNLEYSSRLRYFDPNMPLAEKRSSYLNGDKDARKAMGKKVLIVIVNWNGKEKTVDCLESLKRITYSNYEIVVVDNNSIDSSIETLRERFPNITLIESRQNLGFAEGSNMGVRYALSSTTDYVLFLNNDVIVDKSFLTELVKFAESDDSVGIVGPKIYFYSEPGKIWSKGAKISFPNIINIGANEEDCVENEQPQRVDSITGCALFVKTKVLNEIGLFDGSLFMIHEDLDLCIRANKLGYSCYNVPSSKIWHRASSSIKMKTKSFGTYYFYRNWFLVVKKHFGRWMFTKVLLEHILNIFPRQIKYLINNSELNFEFGFAYIHSILDAVFGRTPNRYL